MILYIDLKFIILVDIMLNVWKKETFKIDMNNPNLFESTSSCSLISEDAVEKG